MDVISFADCISVPDLSDNMNTKNMAGRIQIRKAEINDELKVFCRIQAQGEREHCCVTVVSTTAISLTSSQNPNRELQCSFYQVLDENASHITVFETVALPLINDIFKGKNSLLILCANTESGKTCTITGNTKKDGILSHCLHTIFSSIIHLQADKFLFRPDKMNGFEVQSEEDALKDRQNELYIHLKTTKACLHKMRKETYTEVAEKIVNVQYPPSEEIDEDNAYAVFVSLIVFYKNGIYDLLDTQDVGRLKPLQTKLLREDSSHNMYVHGVVEEEVKTTDEALKIYMGGLQKKKIVADLLNTTSKCFHSLFTIRLVQSPLDQMGNTPSIDKNALKVSELCFVDLACTERVDLRRNTGRKLMKSDYVDDSFMTLRMCFDVMRENRLLKNKKLVPFRNSKLTYRFKYYFQEGSKMHMLVCLDPSYGDYDDMLAITRFADVKEVSTVEQKHHVKSESKKTRKGVFQVLNSERERIIDQGGSEFLDYEESYSLNSTFPCLEMISPKDDKTINSLINFLQSRKDMTEALGRNEEYKEESFRAHLEEMARKNVLLKQEYLMLQHTLDHIKYKENALEKRLKRADTEAKKLTTSLENANSEYETLKKELTNQNLKRKQVEVNNRKLHKDLDLKMVTEMNKSAQCQRQKLKEQAAKFKEQEEKIGKPLARIRRIVLDEATTSISDSSQIDMYQLEVEAQAVSEMSIQKK